MPSKVFEGIGFFHRELWVFTLEHLNIVPEAIPIASSKAFGRK